MKTYTVAGWFNGSDFDKDSEPNCVVEVRAKSSSEAEDRADGLFRKNYGVCEVVAVTV